MQIDDIFIAIYEVSGIPKWELLEYNRKHTHTDYRHIAAYLIKEYKEEFTLREIGMYLNFRDAGTIRNSLKKVKDSLHIDPIITKKYYNIIKKIRPMTQEEKLSELKNQQKIIKQRINGTWNYSSPAFKQAQSDMIRITTEIEELEKEINNLEIK